MDFYFQGIWRMDWGLGNPNKTAALIAMLMIAVWVLPLIRRWLFWLVLPVFVALGICLMHTMSRGGTLAVFAGLGVLLWQVRRAAWPWPRLKVLAGGAAVIAIFAGAMVLQTTTRFAQGPQDRSISNRLQIWKYTPRMMVDAPAGWGWLRSDMAYSQWYQPLDKSERYRTLVNTHLTWMVEFGWPLRALYVFAWAVVFVLCWPPSAWRRGVKMRQDSAKKEAPHKAKKATALGIGEGRVDANSFLPDAAKKEAVHGIAEADEEPKATAGGAGESPPKSGAATGLAARAGFGIAFGLWLAFFVASIFSAVAEERLLWGLPVAGLLVVLVVRAWRWTWPGVQSWAGGLGGAVLVLAAFYAAGIASPSNGLRTEKNGGIVFDASADEEFSTFAMATETPATAASAAPAMPSAATLTTTAPTASIQATSSKSAIPQLWFLTPDRSTAVSIYYPRDWRGYAQQAALKKEPIPVVGFARRVAELPDLKGRKLAVMGALSKAEWEALRGRLEGCGGLLLLAPDIPAEALPLPDELKQKTGVVFGEFSMQPSAQSWRGTPGYQQLEGTGDFFQNWPELVLGVLLSPQENAPLQKASSGPE